MKKAGIIILVIGGNNPYHRIQFCDKGKSIGSGGIANYTG